MPIECFADINRSAAVGPTFEHEAVTPADIDEAPIRAAVFGLIDSMRICFTAGDAGTTSTFGPER